MSTTTSINSVSYSSIDALGSSFAAGIYTALKEVGGQPPMEGADEYEELPVTFLGVSGVGLIWGDFRGRDISVDLVFVNTSKANVETARNGLITGMQSGSAPPARFSVTVPGGSARAGCKLMRGGVQPISWFTLCSSIGGTRFFCQLVRFHLRQMSTSN